MAQGSGQEGLPSTDNVSDSGPAERADRTAADTTIIELPPSGHKVSYLVGSASRLELQFDPTEVQIAQAENDLLLEFPNGSQVALRDFDDDEGEAPDVVLFDGTTIDGDTLVQQLEQLGSLPPIETAAEPQGGSSGGGSSVYQSNLGELIAGLQSLGGDFDPDANVSIPGAGETPPDGESDIEILNTLLGAPAPEAPDIAAPFVPPENPVGPGADTALFTNRADTIDLNQIDVGGYQDGTQYDAGRGNDTVILAENARQALEAGYEEGTGFDAGRGHDQVTGGGLADLIDGAQGHDTLFGNAGDDSLFGGNGHDSLFGGADNDLLDGERNNDLLLGGSGDDSLLGGHGRDTLEGEAGRDLLRGGSSNDSLLGGDDDDSLFGDSGRDTLDGGLGADFLDGGTSHDVLLGGRGGDILLGGSHNDQLSGQRGDDTLDGGSGRDTLDGGLGDDVISGGAGRDVFSFSLAENQGNDVVLDFQSGNRGDRLELNDLLDVNSDSVIDVADLDAGGHTVTGTADSVVITFEQGGSLTLEGLDGSGVDSFADLLNMNVNIDIS